LGARDRALISGWLVEHDWLNVTALLRIEGLIKRYGANLAVDGFSLSVQLGEFVSLLGPSGCGKTTVLQMIGGFVRPDAGRMLLDGADLVAMNPSERGLGIVFQSYALFPHMTAAQNVAYGLEARRIARAERAWRVAEALELVGLQAHAGRYPRLMSGGQQQRVALARALVIQPAILLLDEPLSNLDAKLREDMQLELRNIQQRTGTTTLLVTHDQAEALALSDRVVVMNKGRIEQVDTPEAVYGAPATAFVASFLGKINLLEIGVADAEMRLGGLTWPAPAGLASGSHTMAIRPERIRFTDGPGLQGEVKSRVFQGMQWLLEVTTGAGTLLVLHPNDGHAPPGPAGAVRLVWQAADMHPATHKPGQHP
jgi:putative spermidine/putrescine transport system ATP-binding protein